ncbi:MAG: DMT family transporter [Deltaproteobacteria bacterium]|nr:DMT family transporter [Deltaproteobacteria bacterium]
MKPLLTMLASTLCFALMSTSVALAHARAPELGTALSSFVRSIVNLGVLLALAGGRVSDLLGDRRPALWWRGLSGAVALITYFAALSRIGAGEAAFLNQTSSAWVAAIAPLALGERTSPLTWLAVLASAAGTAALGWPRVDSPTGDLAGRLLGLVSGLSAAAAYLAIRRATSSNGPAVIVFYFTLLSTVASALMMVALPAPLPTDPWAWVYLCGAGLFATGGQLLMTSAYQQGPVATMAAVSAGTPLFTTLLAALLLGQRPDPLARLGMGVLVLASVALPFLSLRQGQRSA